MKVVDEIELPVPTERGEWDAEPHAVPTRTDLKPIEITQPEGASFTVDGNEITWADWSFRFGFDVREGLTLHQLPFATADRERPVVYRASVAEMVVPYADPSPVRYWQNYFDQGEYLFGRYTNSLGARLRLPRRDQVLRRHHRRRGRPPQGHEERDLPPRGGLRRAVEAHRHVQPMAETRRSRRLVISFFLTIGNYDYGFYWYLYLDGTIQLEAKATGIVFASAYRGPDGFSTEMAPGLGAPFHQHMFSARLDMAVDGDVNVVEEVDAVAVPMGPDNPWGNAFRPQRTKLTRESEGHARRRQPQGAGLAHHQPHQAEPVGAERRVRAAPGGAAGAPGRSVQFDRQACRVRHQAPLGHAIRPRGALFGRRLREPASGEAGLPSFVAQDRNIDGEDIVCGTRSV